MHLLLDLGNSRCKWAWADPALHPGGVIEYDNFTHNLDRAFRSLATPQRVVVSSVAASERGAQLAGWLQQRWAISPEIIRALPQQCGVRNGYEAPARLGADRWAALVAARARQRGAVCVIDCGSAVTLDVLDEHGEFRGGVILPGLALQRQALQRGTAGIDQDEGQAGSCLARSTGDGVAAGTLTGLAGAIDRIVECQARELGQSPVLLLTGGDATALRPRLRHASLLVPDLVLEGLASIAAETVPA